MVNQLGEGLSGKKVTVSAEVGQRIVTDGFPTLWMYEPVLKGNLVATTSMQSKRKKGV